jgi:hypothetical protein
MAKPKVKVSITCPRCGVKNVKEANNYHKIIHGDYFKVNDVLDFDEVNENVKSGVYQPFILSDLYHYINHFPCCGCGKNIKITYHNVRSWGGESQDIYTVQPAGNFIDPVVIKRFFAYLDTKGRSQIEGKNVCQKQIFVTRVWNLIKHKFKDRPFMMRDSNGDRQIIYIGGISYHLGYGEEIAFYGISPLGKMAYYKLSQYDMQKFEYVEIPHDLCKQIMGYIGEM